MGLTTVSYPILPRWSLDGGGTNPWYWILGVAADGLAWVGGEKRLEVKKKKRENGNYECEKSELTSGKGLGWDGCEAREDQWRNGRKKGKRENSSLGERKKERE